ncbi:MAG TPA: permease prefix domain 1-containing protein [Actinomycetota bacterium]|nr:permease prefix domain 1-containing protein [Actinomycetota bacterium]
MGRRQQASDPIGIFLARLEPDIVGHARLRRRLVEEMRGHLEDSTQRHLEQGLKINEAQRMAISDFGPREVVVGLWAESKGVGVPTTFTRFAGLAGIIGAAGLGITLLYHDMSVSFSRGAFAELALSFLVLLAISFVALYMRVRGKLLPYGRIGSRLMIAGLILTVVSNWLWFAPTAFGGFIAMPVGLGLYLLGAMRSGVVPRRPIAIWIGGLLAAFSLGALDLFLQIDAGPLAPAVAMTAFVVGWIWLGAHLWSETPNVSDPQAA